MFLVASKSLDINSVMESLFYHFLFVCMSLYFSATNDEQYESSLSKSSGANVRSAAHGIYFGPWRNGTGKHDQFESKFEYARHSDLLPSSSIRPISSNDTYARPDNDEFKRIDSKASKLL